jgi:hypothetical protein
MEKKQAFWTTKVEVVLQTLKEVLCTAPNFAYLHPGKRFVVDRRK